jgi:hypothetical protein
MAQATTEGRGWISFAAIMLMLVGALNIIDGLVALLDDTYLTRALLFSNLTAWGWFFLIWGIIQVLAGFVILRRVFWGVYVGILTAFVNILAQFTWLKTYPVWAVIAIAIDVLVLYALLAKVGIDQPDNTAIG